MTPIQKVDVLRAACCVAGADSNTDQREMAILQRLAEQVGVGDASLQAMIQRAESDNSFCEEQFEFLKESPSECIAVMMQVAAADGKVTDDEQQVLQKLALNLGIAPEIFGQLLETTRNMTQSNNE